MSAISKPTSKVHSTDSKPASRAHPTDSKPTSRVHPADTPAVEQQQPVDDVPEGGKKEEGAEDKTKIQDGGKKQEEGAETVSAPRRSSRIKHPLPIAKAVANGSKRGPGRKRSAEEIEAGEHAEGAESKKKARMHKEEGISLGSELPNLTLKNEKDEDMKLKELQGDSKGVIFFLVPKADTPGCTTQACGFRDIYSDFEQHGFKVFCVSVDTSKQQAKWQTKRNLPYQLLSDPKRSFINALGAGTARTIRSHFIFVNSKLVDKKIPVKAADSPQLALKFVKSFKGDGKAPSMEAKEKEEEEKIEENKVPTTPEKAEEKKASEAEAANHVEGEAQATVAA